MPLSQGEVLNQRYRVVKLLGKGGFGAVYRVWDMHLDCPRALKENLDTTPEAQRQFKREAQMLTVLSHPNLPKVIDHFIIPGQGQYLVMDFVQGQDLKTMLEAQGSALAEAQVLPWIEQICQALEYLHAQNPPVIHRDIKPANIRITPEGRAYLVDFGIAKIYDASLKTTLGARAVTMGFSPPEQYGMGVTDAQSDVYALGATLYTVLSGHEPPASVDIVANKNMKPAALRELNPEISAHVSEAVERAMRTERAERFASIADFHKALQPAPRPVTASVARPPAAAPVSLETALPQAEPRSRSSWQSCAILFIVAVACVILPGIFLFLNGDINFPRIRTQTAAVLQTYRTATAFLTFTSLPATAAAGTAVTESVAEVESTQPAEGSRRTPSITDPAAQPTLAYTDSPEGTLELQEFTLTGDWVRYSTGFCHFRDAECWATSFWGGVVYGVMRTANPVTIDPTWPAPRLLFWLRYTSNNGSLLVGVSYEGQTITLQKFRGSTQWREFQLSLQEYAGKELYIWFSIPLCDTCTESYWGVQKIRIVPE